MLSQRAKRNINRIIPFGLIWLVFSIVYTLLERGLLGKLKYYPSTGNPYNFSSNILVTPAFALVIGLLVGACEVLYFSKLFRQKSLGKKIVYKTIIYMMIIVLFLLITTVFANALEFKASVFNKRVWDNAWAFFFNYAFVSVAVYMSAIILVSQFYAEVSENIGPSVLANFFTGKYHQPTEEERIFMFLDMRASTTIAEQLGHVKYFEMLNEYYADLSEAVVDYYGEIYQYVGDEIVVSWNPKKGLDSNNCIQCFFAMKKAINKQSEKYNNQFGLLPEFKAGFHVGKVTTGEIGVIKKEIIFTGDVLNATARIQGLCNSFGVDLLVSVALMSKMRMGSNFQAKSFGEIELKGKGERIELFTILQGNT